MSGLHGRHQNGSGLGQLHGGVPILGQSPWLPVAGMQLAMHAKQPGTFAISVQPMQGFGEMGTIEIMLDLMLQRQTALLEEKRQQFKALVAERQQLAAEASEAEVQAPAEPPTPE